MKTIKLKSDYQAPDTAVLGLVQHDVLCESVFSVTANETLTEEDFAW